MIFSKIANMKNSFLDVSSIKNRIKKEIAEEQAMKMVAEDENMPDMKSSAQALYHDDISETVKELNRIDQESYYTVANFIPVKQPKAILIFK